MSLGTLHGSYGVEIGTNTGGILLGGITQLSIPLGADIRSETQSGDLYPRIQTLNAQNPRASWTSKAIAKALTKAAMLGHEMQGATDTDSWLYLYARQHDDGGTRKGDGFHKKYQIRKGLIVPTTLSCDHQGDALVSHDAFIIFDGTNDPIELFESQNLSTLALADDERFGLGSLVINSVSYSGVKSIEVAFGVNVVTESADGDIWPTFCSIRNIKPIVTWRGVSVQWLKDTGGIPLTGGTGAHANTTQYFRKRSAGGTFVANGTAQHVKLTMDGIVYIDPALDASGDEPAECTMIMVCQYDGSNLPIVINPASTIT